MAVDELTKLEAEKLKANIEHVCPDLIVREIGDKQSNKIIYKFLKRIDRRKNLKKWAKILYGKE